MQVWACMAVRSISYRKGPLRRAALTQFGISSAPPNARALRGLGQAVQAWDATSGLCAPGPRRGHEAADPLQAISYLRNTLTVVPAPPPEQAGPQRSPRSEQS